MVVKGKFEATISGILLSAIKTPYSSATVFTGFTRVLVADVFSPGFLWN
jgi:hypothetical protein